jgi:YHS domain-containing protein
VLSSLGPLKKNEVEIFMMQTEPMKNEVDPVCGMSVNPATTQITADVEGHHYYFCAEGCREAFVENPQKFLEPQCDRPKGWWGRYMQRLKKATGGKAMKCH